jgi:hypothetical protein
VVGAGAKAPERQFAEILNDVVDPKTAQADQY